MTGLFSGSSHAITDHVALYITRDVFNSDEFGLCYLMSLETTVHLNPISGSIKDRERIFVLVCSNADGSEKLKLMIIGTAMCLRPFKTKSGSEMEIRTRGWHPTYFLIGYRHLITILASQRGKRHLRLSFHMWKIRYIERYRWLHVLYSHTEQ